MVNARLSCLARGAQRRREQPSGAVAAVREATRREVPGGSRRVAAPVESCRTRLEISARGTSGFRNGRPRDGRIASALEQHAAADRSGFHDLRAEWQAIRRQSLPRRRPGALRNTSFA